jgi:hypothetical protein
MNLFFSYLQAGGSIEVASKRPDNVAANSLTSLIFDKVNNPRILLNSKGYLAGTTRIC